MANSENILKTSLKKLCFEINNKFQADLPGVNNIIFEENTPYSHSI